MEVNVMVRARKARTQRTSLPDLLSVVAVAWLREHEMSRTLNERSAQRPSGDATKLANAAL